MIQSKVSSSSIHLLSLSHRHHSPISQVPLFQSHKKQGWARPLACISTKVVSAYNRAEEIKAFDDTQAGVKGLLDSGVLKVPNIFIRPQNKLTEKSDPNHADFQIPVIDLEGVEDNEERRRVVVEGIKNASETWGFFQLVNHGVPTSVLEEMIQGVLGFHEQDGEVKKDFYTRDPKRRVRFNSNFDLYYSSAASWRDSITFDMLLPDPIHPQELPAVCRDITLEYTNHATVLGDTLFQLLSEAMGLRPDYLKQMNCAESCVMISHYYPPCPEPHLTLGAAKHTDPSFLTILLQNDIDGLQVFHQDQWVDIHPIPGTLVVNIGDFLQIVSNDKLKSVQHRVLANGDGRPRISVGCCLTARFTTMSTPIGPIKELISDGHRPVYRDILMKEYLGRFGIEGVPGLEYFKLDTAI